MARSLRTPLTMLTAAMLAASGGCILPPDLQVGDPDAGPAGAPVILSAGPAPEFSFPGPLLLDRRDARTLSLTVQDSADPEVLYARLYVDYDRPEPEPAYAECQAGSTGEVTRVIACPLNSICNPIAEADLGDHVLEVMVANRPFIPNSDAAAAGQPLFRALRDVGVAAFSYRTWLLRCNPPAES